MNLRRNLAKSIRQWRADNTMTQEDFADLVGLHRTYISNIEGEKRAASIDVVQQIAAALKLKAGDLLDR